MENETRQLTDRHDGTFSRDTLAVCDVGLRANRWNWEFIFCKSDLTSNDSHPRNVLVVNALAISLICLFTSSMAEPPGDKTLEEQERIQRKIVPLLDAHCTHCHGGEEPQAGLSLEAASQRTPVHQYHESWEKILRRIMSGEMPPPGEPPLPTDDRFQHAE